MSVPLNGGLTVMPPKPVTEIVPNHRSEGTDNQNYRKAQFSRPDKVTRDDEGGLLRQRHAHVPQDLCRKNRCVSPVLKQVSCVQHQSSARNRRVRSPIENFIRFGKDQVRERKFRVFFAARFLLD